MTCVLLRVSRPQIELFLLQPATGDDPPFGDASLRNSFRTRTSGATRLRSPRRLHASPRHRFAMLAPWGKTRFRRTSCAPAIYQHIREDRDQLVQGATAGAEVRQKQIIELPLLRGGADDQVDQMVPTPKKPASQFTRLYATILQEDDAFTVRVRLSHHLNRSQAAWGEEIAPSIEEASSMIGALAREFAISHKCIAIKIRMSNFKDGTLH